MFLYSITSLAEEKYSKVEVGIVWWKDTVVTISFVKYSCSNIFDLFWGSFL